MEVRIDVAACQGSGNCLAIAPAVFDFDEDANKAVLLQPEPAEDLRETVEAAEAACPAVAIEIAD